MGESSHKHILVSKEQYEQLQALRTIARQKGQEPGGCTLVEIHTPDGISFECRGSCGFIDRFLGRSCTKVRQMAGNGVQVFCSCSGGWFDRLLGRD